MAPKKKEQLKMSAGAFLTDQKLGSWADEMEDMPVSDSRTGYGTERRTYSATTGTYGTGNNGGYSVREEPNLPDKPPFTVHIGNLSFDATNGDITEFFSQCQCTNVRIIEDRVDMKPKGFGYAEFATRDGLKQALALNGSQFQGRSMRISIAEPPKDRGDRPEARELNDWSRKGPLPDLPGRPGMGANRRDFDSGSERRERFPESDNKVRDFGNWERKGPLSPILPPERVPREGGRPKTNDVPKSDGFKDRRSSPAAWGEGRQQVSQEGSRPPRREYQDRSVTERPLTAAEQDNQWRSKMRPDVPVANSPVPSRDGSEAPPSPARSTAVASSRPKLNLAKRTVSDALDSTAITTAGDKKASPFGGAKPIDTAAKEREIEEKRLAAVKQKKEAEEKAVEEKRGTIKLEKDTEDQKKIEILQKSDSNGNLRHQETIVQERVNGNSHDNKGTKSTESAQNARSKPSEASAWRRPSNGPLPPRDDIPKGPKAARGGGGRGRIDGHDGPRLLDDRQTQQKTNGSNLHANIGVRLPTESEAKALEEEGWSTVSKPKKNNRGANQASRSIVS